MRHLVFPVHLWAVSLAPCKYLAAEFKRAAFYSVSPRSLVHDYLSVDSAWIHLPCCLDCRLCSATFGGIDNNMITSIHTLIYSDDANATRAFLRRCPGVAVCRRGVRQGSAHFQSLAESRAGRAPDTQRMGRQNLRLSAPPCDFVDVRRSRNDGGRVAGEGWPASFQAPIRHEVYGHIIMMRWCPARTTSSCISRRTSSLTISNELAPPIPCPSVSIRG